MRAEAGLIENLNRSNEKQYRAMLSKKWAATNSLPYFRYVLALSNRYFKVDEANLTELDRLYLTMLHYDFWQEATTNMSLSDSIATIGSNKDYLAEIKEYLHLRISLIDFEESKCSLGYEQPLQLHARYTRDQILVAFGLSTLHKKSSNREGTAENKKLNTELLFINLQKSEEDFSPTTMYDDYAIDETLFHWQSQGRTADNSATGMSYIKQVELNKKIIFYLYNYVILL